MAMNDDDCVQFIREQSNQEKEKLVEEIEDRIEYLSKKFENTENRKFYNKKYEMCRYLPKYDSKLIQTIVLNSFSRLLYEKNYKCTAAFKYNSKMYVSRNKEDSDQNFVNKIKYLIDTMKGKNVDSALKDLNTCFTKTVAISNKKSGFNNSLKIIEKTMEISNGNIDYNEIKSLLTKLANLSEITENPDFKILLLTFDVLILQHLKIFQDDFTRESYEIVKNDVKKANVHCESNLASFLIEKKLIE